MKTCTLRCLICTADLAGTVTGAEACCHQELVRPGGRWIQTGAADQFTSLLTLSLVSRCHRHPSLPMRLWKPANAPCQAQTIHACAHNAMTSLSSSGTLNAWQRRNDGAAP